MLPKFYKEDIKLGFNLKSLISIVIDNHLNYTLTDDIISDFLSIHKKKAIQIKTAYSKLFNQVNVSEYDHVNMKHLIGHKNYNLYMKELKEKLKFVKENINSYYFDLLQQRKQFTESFYEINNYKKSIYDHTSSVTGRLKITAGKNYLTMKREEKLNLKSKDNFVLFEIDVVSCEPNLLSRIIKNKKEKDIYSLFSTNKERKKLKRAVIATIYGMHEKNCSKMTGIDSKTIKKINEYFKINDIKEKLENEFAQNSFIKNIYGRHLIKNNNLINHYIQSSAADFCMSAFMKFSNDHNVQPIAIIHDAFIFQVEKEKKEKIMSIKEIIDPITNISLPIDKRIIHE